MQAIEVVVREIRRATGRSDVISRCGDSSATSPPPTSPPTSTSATAHQPQRTTRHEWVPTRETAQKRVQRRRARDSSETEEDTEVEAIQDEDGDLVMADETLGAGHTNAGSVVVGGRRKRTRTSGPPSARAPTPTKAAAMAPRKRAGPNPKRPNSQTKRPNSQTKRPNAPRKATSATSKTPTAAKSRKQQKSTAVIQPKSVPVNQADDASPFVATNEDVLIRRTINDCKCPSVAYGCRHTHSQLLRTDRSLINTR
jgi:hypothetical protein